ncbi:MAG: adenylyltransferase/cytidyltransferase family protein [Clostridiales bacterium]|jgi:[citrate (pro-3S)-lyase] ligase|nr:adenylyltransferase/cytidyltransferase family protein [Clostridiales bacterium]
MTVFNENYIKFITKWSRYVQYIDLTALLRENSYNNIAIYGGGDIGKILYEYLYGSDITVKCIIDRNPKLEFPYDVEVLLPRHFESSGIEVDAIFVTAYEYEKIFDYLRTFVRCDIIWLQQFVVDVDDLRLLSMVEEHIKKSGVKMYILDSTCILKYIKNPSIAEQNNILSRINFTNYYYLHTEKPKTELLYQYYNDLPDCNDEYINKVYSYCSLRLIDKNGIDYLQDITSEYYNVIDGIRFTTDNPAVYDNTIHFFGNCSAVGCFAEDKYTIESQLQRMINDHPINCSAYRVLNRANWGRSPGSFRQILNTDFSESDIILLFSDDVDRGLKYYFNSDVINYTSIVSAFDRPHNMDEILFDFYHTNHRGYKLYADKIYSILSEPFKSTEDKRKADIMLRGFIPPKAFAKANENKRNDLTLKNYTEFLRNEAVDIKGIIGSIVMNCNPFTNGHRYLIEHSLELCDFLYIFVVEEDKSFFSFEDRLMLVKQGTSDLPNVKVIPGGKFIISSVTLPEYFDKETNPDVKIDASKDVNIFAETIAPTLNITKRFLGEEPLDPITNQYNQALLETLPKSGVSVTIIPRKEFEQGKPISASTVRKLLKDKDFDAISQIVPKTTLDYLKTR